MAPSTPVSGLSLPCLLLLLLLEIPGAGAQEFQLLQPQGAVSVSAGETLTLTCSVTGLAPPGPLKWFKGSGSGRRLVYSDAGSFPRVTRAVSGSDTDFTIRISDTRSEDAGIYHCVKFKKGSSGADEEFRSGAGTTVSVSGECELPPATHPSPPGAGARAGNKPSSAQTLTGELRFPPRLQQSGTWVETSTCQSLFSSPALWIGLFLEKVLTAAFLLFLFLRNKE
nr:tyrosine-protein phosphatase non-receptor type substrate 1-like [Chelonoidis abingdonii]